MHNILRVVRTTWTILLIRCSFVFLQFFKCFINCIFLYERCFLNIIMAVKLMKLISIRLHGMHFPFIVSPIEEDHLWLITSPMTVMITSPMTMMTISQLDRTPHYYNKGMYRAMFCLLNILLQWLYMGAGISRCKFWTTRFILIVNYSNLPKYERILDWQWGF